MQRRARRGSVVGLALLLLLVLPARPVRALDVGDAAPAFDLPLLAEDGRISAPGCFSEAPATVLLIWDRGCPHCLDLALSSSALADSVEPLGARVLGIVLGPDDPYAIKDLLWERMVTVRHLWDRERRTAGAYDLGIKHLGVFVVDHAAVVRARFDDKLADLAVEVEPAVLEVIERAASDTTHGKPPLSPIATVPTAQTGLLPQGWPALSVDGRTRLMSTEGARPGDTGLFGEPLENGTLLLFRWDLRLNWELNQRIVFEPWLRVSNESDAVLTEGAEQLTSPHGTLSLRYEDRHLSGTLGAYPLRLSPLTMQRWDLDDVPPIGGGSGGASCACAGGALGFQQQSLEILDTDYTLEGASAGVRSRWGVAQGWIAIPRHERSAPEYPTDSSEQPRYRRIIYGGALDLGKPVDTDRVFGLPSPIGLRAGILWLEDDKRSLDASESYEPEERDERVNFVLGTLGPWQGISADVELAEVRSNDSQDSYGRGLRGGVRAERGIGRVHVWGRLHRIQIDRGFDPFYRALTYDENREGWRYVLGARILPFSGAAREWLGLTLFSRSVCERTPSDEQDQTPPEWNTYDISLLARPYPDLVAEAHWVLLQTAHSPEWVGDTRTTGASLETRWEGLGSVEPTLKVEAIRPEPGDLDPTTIWQTYAYVRVLK